MESGVKAEKRGRIIFQKMGVPPRMLAWTSIHVSKYQPTDLSGINSQEFGGSFWKAGFLPKTLSMDHA